MGLEWAGLLGHGGVMTQHNTPLVNPGQLLAEVPGLLGFYPDASVLVMAFNHDSGKHYTLGATARMDLADAVRRETVAEVVGALTQQGPDLIFVFIVDPEAAVGSRRRVVRSMVQEARTSGAHLAGVWTTRRIVTDEPYELCWCPGGAGAQKDPMGCWRQGTIAPIVRSHTMDEMAAQGCLPELDRQDALEFFGYRDDLMDRDACARAQQQWTRDSVELTLRLCTPDGDLDYADVAALARDVFGTAGQEEDLDLLAQASALLDAPLARDITIYAALQNPQQCVDTVLWAARHLEGNAKANALATWVVLNLRLGRMRRISLALAAGYLACPEHRLITLLWQAYSHGFVDAMLDTFEHLFDDERAGYR